MKLTPDHKRPARSNGAAAPPVASVTIPPAMVMIVPNGLKI